MKALKLVAPQRLELGTLPDPPDPGPGEVLVRLRSTGVCGSDMHFFSEGGIAGYAAEYPRVLCHEPAGEVLELGKGVEDLAVGTKVAVEPAIVREECEFSRSGHPNKARHGSFFGGDIPGALREYAVMPRRNLLAMPEGMTFADASFIEPLAVLLHSMELAELKMGESVTVMGAGPIGLLAVALSKLAGASTVIVADRVEHRLKRAIELGADLAINIDKDSPVDAVMDLTGWGTHVVFDAAGKPESISNSVACLRPGGRMVLIGIPSESPVPVDFWRAMHSEATIKVQHRSNGNDHDALDMLKRGVIRSDAIISHRFSMENGQEAFDTMQSYRDGIIKPLIEW